MKVKVRLDGIAAGKRQPRFAAIADRVVADATRRAEARAMQRRRPARASIATKPPGKGG